MSLYVVRHGETDWNVQHRVQGKADIELNEIGISQAKSARKELPHENIDLIICSPLKRAVQTARIISQGLNTNITFDGRISERDFGEFEGLTKSDFDFTGYWSYQRNYMYDKAENIKDFFKRVYSFLEELQDNYYSKNVLLVTHGGVSIPIHCYFKGIPKDDNLLKVVLGNCEVAKFDFVTKKPISKILNPTKTLDMF